MMFSVWARKGRLQPLVARKQTSCNFVKKLENQQEKILERICRPGLVGHRRNFSFSQRGFTSQGAAVSSKVDNTTFATNQSWGYEPIFQDEFLDTTEWVKCPQLSPLIQAQKLGKAGVSFTYVPPEVLTEVSETCVRHVNHFYRRSHLLMLHRILNDPAASDNDKYVAKELLNNAEVSAKGILPSCQDTGTAVVMAKRGYNVLTNGTDEQDISLGILNAYQNGNLRYSQVAPQTMFTEKNTKTNLPAQIDIMAAPGSSYKGLYIVKGGGSANKTQLFQKTKALLNEASFEKFIVDEIMKLGTAACPPYHLAVVVGGLGADQNLKTVKLASCKYYDQLPDHGSANGRAFRDRGMESKILYQARNLGIGAQFGGKYFLHDVRVIRLPRHGASCPVGIGVSCSADRQMKVAIQSDGVFYEKLEQHPEKLWELNQETLRVETSALDSVATEGEVPGLSEMESEAVNVAAESKAASVVNIDLDQPMDQMLKTLRQYPVKTRVALNGTMIVARDIAHARMQGKLQKGGADALPDYIKKHPVYYAGPAKTPEGYPSGSFGPTTSGRMDPYVEPFQAVGGSMIMIGKGNRSQAVTDACAKHGGFYLGSIGGMAATLSANCIKSVEVLDMEELGMEAVWKIRVENFPAFIIVDDKGNDFFQEFKKEDAHIPEEVNSSIYVVLEFFENLDRNSDQIVEAMELVEGFDNLTIEQAETLVRKYDLGHFGGLNLDEFLTMVMKERGLKIDGEGAREKLLSGE
ncbi:unnamed protein product [Amoebophrya sp. A25]|nr:unnamed protein product [Amoebophrya sp. A25]|eukprot:GSA25T00000065001.1